MFQPRFGLQPKPHDRITSLPADSVDTFHFGFPFREMFFTIRHLSFLLSFVLFLCAFSITDTLYGQSASDDETDPVALFQKAQELHEKGELARAIELYESAIKLRPEFPEAEYQRASAEWQLGDHAKAASGFRRAIELKPSWSMPYSALGTLLLDDGHVDESLNLLVHSLKIDSNNIAAWKALAESPTPLNGSSTAVRSALNELKSSPQVAEGKPLVLAAMAALEQASGDEASALKHLDQAISADPKVLPAYIRRAMLRGNTKNYGGALEDALAANRLAPNSLGTSILLARLYAQKGETQTALAVLDGLPPGQKASAQAQSLRATIVAATSDSAASRDVLEELLKKDPKNATVLSRLGALYRLDDPARSADYYKRALEIEPSNASFATGYASALVQARQFQAAIGVLRQVLRADPENFAAHANIATALYETKQYAEAIEVYNWLLKARPDLYVAYYFIATSYDFLNQFPEALAAYETFLAKAEPSKNQLEIEKVNLRIPVLRNQIKNSNGGKSKRNSE